MGTTCDILIPYLNSAVFMYKAFLLGLINNIIGVKFASESTEPDVFRFF
jgi:hypothetical protein